MTNWILNSPARFRLVAALSVIAMGVLMIALLAVRVSRWEPATTPSAAPTVVSTALTPPTPTDLPPTAATQIADSGPVAAEAVRSYLLNDVVGFSTVALPEVAEEVASAPAPKSGGEITGVPVLVHGGPTQQDVQVPTTWGDLNLTMVREDDRWLVESMEYNR